MLVGSLAAVGGRCSLSVVVLCFALFAARHSFPCNLFIFAIAARGIYGGALWYLFACLWCYWQVLAACCLEEADSGSDVQRFEASPSLRKRIQEVSFRGLGQVSVISFLDEAMMA